ncbi:hypothetical protein ACIDE9_03180 [Methylophilus sp. 'Pure River']|uniref:hypothetical protein n=1 Tax=Methylophilus sp. 'Pure River' TaxID=3377117 RepID=UPI00398F6E44
MTNNGSNTWDVPFCDITWFENLLNTHSNITNVIRHDDIVFEVDRIKQSDHLRIFCCRQYAMSLTRVQSAIAEFGPLDLIYIGGGWNGYTSVAKLFCEEQHIGLYVTDEMSGALWQNEYWSYYKRDKKGNPVYFNRG